MKIKIKFQQVICHGKHHQQITLEIPFNIYIAGPLKQMIFTNTFRDYNANSATPLLTFVHFHTVKLKYKYTYF
jgi:hypothetical protein